MKRLYEPDLYGSNQEIGQPGNIQTRIENLVLAEILFSDHQAASELDRLMNEDQGVVKYVLNLIPSINQQIYLELFRLRLNAIEERAKRKTPTFFADEISGATEYLMFTQENSIDDAQLKIFSDALKVNKTLKNLKCQSNYYGQQFWSEKGSICVIKAVGVNTTLNRLQISEIELSEKVILWLAAVVGHNKTLEWLQIDNTPTTRTGVVALAIAVKKNNTLKCLELGNCSIEDVTFVKIAEALVKNNSLTELKLWGNSCSFVGSIAIAKALLSNRALQTLDLSDNPIALDLRGKAIDLEGVIALAASIRTNISLKTLKVSLLDFDFGFQIDDKANMFLQCADDDINEQLEINKKLRALLKDMWHSNPSISLLMLVHLDTGAAIAEVPREVVLYLITTAIERTIFDAKNAISMDVEPSTKSNNG